VALDPQKKVVGKKPKIYRIIAENSDRVKKYRRKMEDQEGS
jgi:hypothetical protein